MTVQFFQTRMGSKFFEADVPRIIEAINRLAAAMEEQCKEKTATALKSQEKSSPTTSSGEQS